MKTPIIVRDQSGLVMLYRTIESLELDLEAIDVQKDEYSAFDAEGQVLSLTAERRTARKVPWFLGGDWKADFVCVGETGGYSKEELKSVLSDFLEQSPALPSVGLKDSLEELVDLATRTIGFEL